MARLRGPIGLAFVAVVALLVIRVAAQQQGTTSGEWRSWGGDAGSTRYSLLDQINRDRISIEAAERGAETLGKNHGRGHVAGLHEVARGGAVIWLVRRLVGSGMNRQAVFMLEGAD